MAVQKDETGAPVEAQSEAKETPAYKRAKVDLFVGQVRAHAAGDLVPTVNVAKNGWTEDVEKA